MGTYFEGRLGQCWDYGGTLAVQRGKWGRDDIDAHGVNLHGGYTFKAPWQPRLGVEYSYASGDSDPFDDEHETFDNVFGAIDCYYGRMNLFAWMNLEDYQASFSVKPKKALKIWIDYHFLRLASDEDAWYYCSGKAFRKDSAGASGQTLGHEVDLLVKWQMTENIELFAGYAKFFPGAFVKRTADSSNAQWAFVQLMYSF